MRILMFAGIAAAMAAAPAAGESVPMQGGRTVPDWGGVPSIPLVPPGATVAPASGAPMGHWSASGGWRGGPAMAPGPRGSWGNWRGGSSGRMAGFRPRPGIFMPSVFVSPTFFVSDWWNYGLAEPGYGRNWVRYYDDAVLIDDRGYIYDTARGIDWGDYGRTYRPYDDGMSRGWAPRYARPYPAAVYYAPPGATTVIVQGPPTVTTTTSYVDEEVPAWQPRPKRTWRPRAKCACK
jgi:hypothetical protein